MRGFKEWLNENEQVEKYSNTRFLGKKVLLEPFIEDQSQSEGLRELVSSDGSSLGKTMYVLHNYWKVVAIGEDGVRQLEVGDIVSIMDSMLVPPLMDMKHPVGNSPDNPHRVTYGNPLDRLVPYRFQDDKFNAVIEPGKRTEAMLHYLPEDLVDLIWDKTDLNNGNS